MSEFKFSVQAGADVRSAAAAALPLGDLDRPDRVGVYVEQSKWGKRPLRHHRRKVRRLLAGKPAGANPYRAVHVAPPVRR